MAKAIGFMVLAAWTLGQSVKAEEQKRSTPPALAVTDRFTPLAGKAVQFHGYLEDFLQNNLAHYNKGKAPYADFVQFFRTGRPQFALGELWGKSVRSGAIYYRYTQDPELKAILQKTVADLLTTKRTNGSISCADIPQQPDGNNGDLWERKYVLLGLDEYYRQVDKDPIVLQAMIDQADCILQQIGPPPKVGITEQGWSHNKIESSTLLEPFLRLYKHTGYPRYLDFAGYIVKSGGAAGCDLVEDACRNQEPAKMGFPYAKCYEMLSYFEGVCEYYRVTGDDRYKQAVINLYRNVIQKEIAVTGGGGGPAVYGEAWDNTALNQTDPNAKRMLETCTGVTLSKLAGQICFLSGDPSTIDYIEQFAYNGLIGAMRPSGDFFSYCNRLNGVKSDPEGWGWTFNGFHVTCCSANAAMALAYLPYVAVMNSKTGPVVNLYNAATVQVDTPLAQPARIEITGEYPRTGAISIAVTIPKPEHFTLCLRIPAWSKQTSLSVNGQSMRVTPGSYAEIDREWASGDAILLTLDMRCRVIDAPHGRNRAGDHFQAVLRGPIVLARDENRDAAFDQPVSIIAQDGYVVGALLPPATPPSLVQVRIPVAGGTVDLVDYASVNSWTGKRICTWLPMAGFPYPQWIWHPEYVRGTASAPEAKRWFRRMVECPADGRLKRAVLRLSADDAFVAFVNGRRAGEGRKWQEVVTIDCTADLHAGRNIIAVEAENLPFQGPNAAGLIAALTMEYDDGSRSVVVTDGQWRVHDQVENDWQEVDHPADGWKVPSLLGLNGTQPWTYLPLEESRL